MNLLAIPFVLTLFTAPAQEPPPGIGSAPAPGGGQKEMLELFAKVERRLNEIDKLLFDASAGDIPTGPVADAGIDELLKGAIQRGKEAQEGIDKILELARSMQPSSGGGGGQPQQQKPGESPLDEQRNQDGGQREQTPQQPGESQPGPAQPDPEQPKGAGPDPETDPGNRAAQDPPTARTERVGTPDSADSWGTLPIHVREIFRAEGADDLPPQYRDWIDGYYRRLQRIERR